MGAEDVSVQNGMRRWLIGVGTAVLLAFSGWLGMGYVSHGERLTKTETRVDGLQDSLTRIERKIDRLMDRR